MAGPAGENDANGQKGIDVAKLFGRIVGGLSWPFRG